MNSLVLHSIPRYRSHSSFKFGDKTVNSCECIELYLRAPEFMYDILEVYNIVPVDVPALLG